MVLLTKAAFIDRDGVINKDTGYVYKIEDCVLMPGAIDGLKLLHSVGYMLVVVTNQAGIARGYYSEKDFHDFNTYMQTQGVFIDKVYYCPHHPTHGVGTYKIECTCRKPKPGMIFNARDELGVDLTRSIMVGDKRSDIDAGRTAGVGTCILVKSGHPVSPDDQAAADYCCDDLLHAAKVITSLTVNRPCRVGGLRT